MFHLYPKLYNYADIIRNRDLFYYIKNSILIKYNKNNLVKSDKDLSILYIQTELYKKRYLKLIFFENDVLRFGLDLDVIGYYISRFRYGSEEEKSDFKLMNKTGRFYLKYADFIKYKTEFEMNKPNYKEFKK